MGLGEGGTEKAEEGITIMFSLRFKVICFAVTSFFILLLLIFGNSPMIVYPFYIVILLDIVVLIAEKVKQRRNGLP